jgi:hypothetical protein
MEGMRGMKAERHIDGEAQFTDCGQLVPQLTLHEVLAQHGEAGATYASGHTERSYVGI